jgi:hypothetical protein
MTTLQQAAANNRLSAALLTGLLGPAVLWLTQFQVKYSLVDYACKTGHRWVLPLASGIAIAAAVSFCLFAWRNHRVAKHAARDETTEPLRDRNIFLAHMGLLSSVFFLAIVVAQALAQLFINPCSG